MTTASQLPNIFRLKASIQNYEWGKPGNTSLCAKYARGALGDDYEVEEDKTYAEIWMGTHQNGPATLWSDPQTSLHGLAMSSPPHFLGARLTTPVPATGQDAKFPHSTHVPFLFKILSIAKALPLQAHPDKALGEALNKADPAQFVDANHKPEIAVALADGFRGFVGFREPGEIARALEGVPELREAVGDDEIIARFVREQDKESLKAVFTRLLKAEQTVVERSIAKLVGRVEQQGEQAVGGDAGLAGSVVTLNKQYPDDVGVLAAPFFMNLVTLNRGEAIYIGADEAHAYLEGDIIECMAVSDNVLNAAFVPPETRNTDTFLNALTYTARPPAHWALSRTPYKKSKSGNTTAFDPPLEEFTVLHTQLARSATREADSAREYKYGGTQDPAVGQPVSGVGETSGGEDEREVLAGAEGPTIGIVTRGTVEVIEQGKEYESLQLSEGGVVFVRPQTEIAVRSIKGEGEMWWATCSE